MLTYLLIGAVVGGLAAWFVRREISLRDSRELRQVWEDQIRQAETQRDRVRVTLVSRERRVAALEAEGGAFAREVDQLQRQLADRDLVIRDLEETVQNRDTDHQDSSRRLLQVAGQAEILKTERDRAREELERQNRKVDEIEAEIQLYRDMLSTAEQAIRERDRKLEQKEREAPESPKPSEPTPAAPPFVARPAPLRQSQEDLDALFSPASPVAELLNEGYEPRTEERPEIEVERSIEKTPAQGQTVKVSWTPPPVGMPLDPEAVVHPHGGESRAADDLTRIRGIGAGFAKRLEELGVTRLEQIAQWTEEDAETFCEVLRASKKRVHRWINQARRLTD